MNTPIAIQWDAANREFINREIDSTNKTVIEYFRVTGESGGEKWQAVAVYVNGCFETLIDKERI